MNLASGSGLRFILTDGTRDTALLGTNPNQPRVTDEAIPVSYTHLRAHETVLDLVCRLLLEKKKNQLPKYVLIRNHESL